MGTPLRIVIVAISLHLVHSYAFSKNAKISTRIVQTRYGRLQGLILPMDQYRYLKKIEVFLGVPYATPPVQSNRFSPTRTPSPWDGVRVSDKLGPVCPQKLPDISNETAALEKMPKGRLEYLKRLLPLLKNQSEDCLYLNIYAPAQDSTIALSSFHIVIPSAVVRGRNAVLACLYDLEGQPLYTLKWYKGNREFYRYTPRDSPPIKVFPIDGLTVNEDVSNDTHVLLENVSDDNRGKYSCELSADAPSFITKIETGTLNVVDLPAEDPTIEGLKLKYRIGEVLKANCTSGESAPATNLTWFVNGRRTEEQKAYHQHRITRKGRHMESSYSILKIPITKELFRKGRLKIRCVASIHDVYYRSLEKSVDLEKKRHHHNHQQHKHLHRIQQDGKAETFFATTIYPHAEDIEWEYEALPAERHPEVVRAFEVSNRNGNGSCNEFSAWNLFLTVIVLFLIQER